MDLRKLEKIIHNFMNMIFEGKIEVYNEFSFQHELGIYLRENIDTNKYIIQFERNVSFFGINKSKTLKKEMDIVIYDKNKMEKYCIELKFPLNGQYPESMYSFIKDLKFCEQICEYGFSGSITLVLVEDKLFFEGQNKTGIYQYFRSNAIINGNIVKPTGKRDEEIIINNKYQAKWIKSDNEKSYYLISISESANSSSNILIQDVDIKKDEVSMDIERKTSNITVKEICNHIENLLNNAKKSNNNSVILISGELHKSLNMKNAMPTVCNAMRKVAQRYPGSIIRKPDTVIGQNSSTISVEYILY